MTEKLSVEILEQIYNRGRKAMAFDDACILAGLDPGTLTRQAHAHAVEAWTLGNTALALELHEKLKATADRGNVAAIKAMLTLANWRAAGLMGSSHPMREQARRPEISWPLTGEIRGDGLHNIVNDLNNAVLRQKALFNRRVERDDEH